MNKLLTRFLSKSFSELAPNSTVTNSMVAHVIETAAMTQDFLENTTKKLGNKPNADIIFERIKECDLDRLKQAFLFLLEFMIKGVQKRYNYRSWMLAIDIHYEPFYGNYKDIWVHGYKPKGCKDCRGSYCFITIAVVIGEEKFTLLALPVHLGQNKAELLKELLAVAKTHLRIRMVLLDRGFHGGSVARQLNHMHIKYIIFVRRNEKIERFFCQVPAFSHRYFHDSITWYENKSTQREPVKYILIRDYIDLRTFKIYDWCFLTNLSNIEALSYVHLYMKRWCIENTYKQFKAFKIMTASVHVIVRYFFFLCRILLYNLWKFYNAIMGAHTTFKEFVFTLFLSSVSVDHVLLCRNKMRMFLATAPST